MKSRSFRLARLITVGGVVAGGVALLALPAAAHVEIEEAEVAAGSTAFVTFGVPHGCDESPTTVIRIQIPDDIASAMPTQNASWDVAVVTEQLDEPVDVGEGETVTERVKEVDFTAKTPMPVTVRDDLQIAVAVPEDAAGSTLVFPTIQECVEGRTEWTQIAADGQDPEELPHPAPAVAVVASAGEDDHHAATATSDSSASTDSGDDGNGLALAGLITGIAGILVGGGALVVASRKSNA